MARTQLVTKDDLADIPGWQRLKPAEQTAIYDGSRELMKAMMEHGFSGISIGEQLTKIREVLEPKRMFVKFLTRFNFSQKSAYRYMNSFLNAQNTLPEPTLRAAMARGYKIAGDDPDRPLGVYTPIVKRLPPPKGNDIEEIQEWLDKIEDSRRRLRKRTAEIQLDAGDPDTLAKEVFRTFDAKFKRLPKNHKTRANWTRHVMGMMLTRLGVGTQTVEPASIPPEFVAVRGRPRKVEEEELEEAS